MATREPQTTPSAEGSNPDTPAIEVIPPADQPTGTSPEHPHDASAQGGLYPPTSQNPRGGSSSASQSKVSIETRSDRPALAAFVQASYTIAAVADGAFIADPELEQKRKAGLAALIEAIANERAAEFVTQEATPYDANVWVEEGELRTNNEFHNQILSRLQQINPLAYARLLEQPPQDRIKLSIKLKGEGLNEAREHVKKICGSTLSAFVMTAMDEKPHEKLQKNDTTKEILSKFRATEVEATSDDWPELAEGVGSFLNTASDDSNSFSDEFRTRLVALESYRSLHKKTLPGMTGALSAGWAGLSGGLLDVLGGPKVEERIDATTIPGWAKVVLKVMYGWAGSGIAESGDATINYTALKALDPQSDLHNDPSLLGRELKKNLPDGVKAGAVSALLNSGSTAMAATGGIPLPTDEGGRAGVSISNAFLNLLFGEIQWIGGALPILLEPRAKLAELTEAIRADCATENGIFTPETNADELAQLAILHSADDGAALTGSVCSAMLVGAVTLVGAKGLGREASVLPSAAASGLQVALANPAEAISFVAAYLGANISIPPAVAKVLNMIPGVSRVSGLDDDGKSDVLAMMIAAHMPIGPEQYNEIDPKNLARLTLAVGAPVEAAAHKMAPYWDALTEGPVGRGFVSGAGYVGSAVGYVGSAAGRVASASRAGTLARPLGAAVVKGTGKITGAVGGRAAGLGTAAHGLLATLNLKRPPDPKRQTRASVFFKRKFLRPPQASSQPENEAIEADLSPSMPGTFEQGPILPTQRPV